MASVDLREAMRGAGPVVSLRPYGIYPWCCSVRGRRGAAVCKHANLAWTAENVEPFS